MNTISYNKVKSYLADTRTRSLTAYDVVNTETSNEIEDITVICLNWVSPNRVPNVDTISMEPTV